VISKPATHARQGSQYACQHSCCLSLHVIIEAGELGPAHIHTGREGYWVVTWGCTKTLCCEVRHSWHTTECTWKCMEPGVQSWSLNTLLCYPPSPIVPPGHLPVHVEQLGGIVIRHVLKLKEGRVAIPPLDSCQELIQQLVVGVPTHAPAHNTQRCMSSTWCCGPHAPACYAVGQHQPPASGCTAGQGP
jgi:hypothetical protein